MANNNAGVSLLTDKAQKLKSQKAKLGDLQKTFAVYLSDIIFKHWYPKLILWHLVVWLSWYTWQA